jgi:hypothetical protein
MHAPKAQNVVLMPRGDSSPIADFLRYHVLVRVFDGDADRWLDELEQRAAPEFESDIRFARWIRTRLRRDPALIERIRRAVERTPVFRTMNDER